MLLVAYLQGCKLVIKHHGKLYNYVALFLYCVVFLALSTEFLWDFFVSSNFQNAVSSSMSSTSEMENEVCFKDLCKSVNVLLSVDVVKANLEYGYFNQLWYVFSPDFLIGGHVLIIFLLSNSFYGHQLVSFR